MKKRLILAGVALVVVATVIVIGANVLLGVPAVAAFVKTYPGTYPLPKGAPVGNPGWLGWQHFLNAFLIILLIKTGMRVKHEKRPDGMWSSRKNRRNRMSMSLWIHQVIDIAWIANGIIYVILLFATGQWMRIVPTSWAVVPNSISTALQYASLHAPTENGWVNYNSLQQLAYFAVVFIIAPLAFVTGLRMSALWPDKNRTRLIKVDTVRKIHFGSMAAFSVFIVVHVGLVFATGAIRNLNHMYGLQDSTSPVGPIMFVFSILVTVAGWFAVNTKTFAPLAKLFGDVRIR